MTASKLLHWTLTIATIFTVVGMLNNNGVGGRSTDPQAMFTPVNATTTNSTSVTLNANDLLNFKYHFVTLADIAEGADLTYTFPASSTLANLVSDIGQMDEVCWFLNATSTDSNIIFAAGTGIDFKTASTTSDAETVSSLRVGSTDEACFQFIRQADASGTELGDITAIPRIYQDID